MNQDIPIARRDVITHRLGQGESVVAAALAAEFGVSEDAIRRDLRALAAEGKCRRVYGGALPVSGHTQPMFARIDKDRPRKEALARRAAASILPGETLFLDAGSTNLALTEFLPEDQELLVVTNSIDIASAVLRRPDLRLLMLGGMVDATVGGCVDTVAVQAATALRIDRCFLGTCGIDARFGATAVLHADAVFKRAVLDVTSHCVALAMNHKFTAKAPHRVCPVAEIELMVVEHDVPDDHIEPLQTACPAIVRADRPGA
ncbi:DeoR/GlpR family DNA-binding transcription regulator [Roseateles asaccharophilus]|uniref:DeoR/GlpR family transcriptional regulator of sugar metabolism n=1 Tax=Roseateles asaccharophilus TaxID=582607 RepID=A0ABU2ACK5_9BURK|nr:DeoR/GlpR family DNA-binding transcription regulator [Roseateles asaccharophilus]MDR7334937.1 DeoR/GlpR family transcriptional regulator of sugar metabolism [Roseateles asaccharophilus]